MTLYTNVTVSLVDALNGFEMDIQHLDGHQVCYCTLTTSAHWMYWGGGGGGGRTLGSQ